MHVDWNWIKQRPHFLFEELTKFCSIDLFYVKKLIDINAKKINNPKVTYSQSDTFVLRKLPFSARSSIVRWFEQRINSSRLKRLLRDYQIIWITSPIILDFIPVSVLANKIVIYDCMDDFTGFYSASPFWIQKDATEKEQTLIRNSDFVFASSQYLKNKISMDYRDDIRREPLVINNGISTSLLELDISDFQNEENKNKDFNLTYIGTVGDWFDFDLIIKVLERYKNINVTLIGPIDTEIAHHPRLNMLGPVDHHALPKYGVDADALVMPFKLSELIRSVDPVKIYEYIKFEKPIIAIKYEEMDKFGSFVNLYSNEIELFRIIEELMSGKLRKIETKEGRSFLNSHTWEMRVKQIHEIVKAYI